MKLTLALPARFHSNECYVTNIWGVSALDCEFNPCLKRGMGKRSLQGNVNAVII